MFVQGWSWRYREPGRRSRSGERSRPGREGGHNHLRSRWPITQGRMRAHAVVMPPPALDDDPTSATPMERIASATGVPCATRTSTWRSFATISSGVCLFLPIVILLRLGSHTSGWTTPTGADHDLRGALRYITKDTRCGYVSFW